METTCTHVCSPNRWIKCNDWQMLCPALTVVSTHPTQFTRKHPLAPISTVFSHPSTAPMLCYIPPWWPFSKSFFPTTVAWPIGQLSSQTHNIHPEENSCRKCCMGAKTLLTSERAQSPFWYSASGRCCHTSLKRSKKIFCDRFPVPKNVTMYV